MADAEWFEVPGTAGDIPNKETAIQMARDAAKYKDCVIEVYRVKRTLVKTIQRQITLQETDTPSA